MIGTTAVNNNNNNNKKINKPSHINQELPNPFIRQISLPSFSSKIDAQNFVSEKNVFSEWKNGQNSPGVSSSTELLRTQWAAKKVGTKSDPKRCGGSKDLWNTPPKPLPTGYKGILS